LVSPDAQREPATLLCLAMMRIPSSGTSRSLRLRQGVILLVGAIVIVLAIGSSPTGFYWTPLALGLIYLVGALAGGSQGSYWATAVVLIGWGAAVVVVRQLNPNLDTSGLYLLGAGVGATTGMLLARRGFAVDPLGMTLTLAAGGAVLALESRYSSVLGDARFYALLLGAVGLVNLLLGAFASGDLSEPTAGPPARPPESGGSR
ncbi:MAG: hypothetical protein ACR2GZ_05905, partial [Solirubrobacteraceae bacterium]